MSEFSKYAYIRRRGRTTSAQAKALEGDLAEYTVRLEDLRTLSSSLYGIEIGFGMGDALVLWAKERAEEEKGLLGVDLYLPGVGSLVNKLTTQDIKNVQICVEPAQEVVGNLPEDCLQEVRILFPDPWPKKRHAKRRLFQSEFVRDLARVLAPDGCVRIATDWDPYAEWIREVFLEVPAFVKNQDEIRSGDETGQREVATKFEQRGERLGHRIHDLVYVPKNSATTVSR